MLWVGIAVTAAALQTARNALQRGLVETAGPWGATLVRFLFGLPFALAWLGLMLGVAAHPVLTPTVTFWAASAGSAVIQVVATAALLVSMRRSSFAVGATFSIARLPIGALLGLLIGDQLPPMAWIGVGLACVGLVALSWPKGARLGQGDWSAAGFGFAAGVLFAVSANLIRAATMGVASGQPWLGAAATLATVQAMQAVGLTAYLAWRDMKALRVSVASWRTSVFTGFFGTAASALWFTAFGMAPVGAVNAVSVVEAPMAAAAGRRLFRERLSMRQVLAGFVATVGVLATALSVPA